VVELARTGDAYGIRGAIAAALDVRDPDRLAELIGERDVLVLLDNCEHLDDAAPLVAELLRGAQRLRILATSRSPLRVSGEQECPVAPLPVPDTTRLPGVPSLADNAAVTLFVDRATRVRPDFALTVDNAAAVAAVCARLDGLPLAIELAAARTRVLPPRALLQRLGDTAVGGALHVLTEGPRDTPLRHRTLRDTVEWSYALLSAAEQVLFRRLAVFVSGCTLDAAEAVCGTATGGAHDVDVLAGVASLADKSLLVPESGPEDEARFGMLETIREFAWERLVQSGEESSIRGRHSAYYRAMVEATGALLFAGEGARERAAVEQGNVQSALRWLVEGD
jgi:predicted ATPase